jgi:hypothetical protein
VSARHQVKRLDRHFEGACSRQTPVRQKKQVFFVRCGSQVVRNFTGPTASIAWRLAVRSGPDVFADALVPAGAGKPGVPFPKILKLFRRRMFSRMCALCLPLSLLAHCGNGYRLAKHQGKPIS